MYYSADQRLTLRLDIYFGLTNKQQRKFNQKFSWHFLEDVPMNEFLKITKNQALVEMLVRLKRSCIRLVVA